MMKTAFAAIVAAPVVAAILGARVLAQPSVQVEHYPVRAFRLHLGAPSQPARMTAAQAVHAAEAVWVPSIFAAHPYRTRYGAYHSYLETPAPQGLVPVGTRDVWAITVTGLNIDRPSAEIAQRDGTFKVEVPPNIHTEVILVDDKSGQVLESVGY